MATGLVGGGNSLQNAQKQNEEFVSFHPKEKGLVKELMPKTLPQRSETVGNCLGFSSHPSGPEKSWGTTRSTQRKTRHRSLTNAAGALAWPWPCMARPAPCQKGVWVKAQSSSGAKRASAQGHPRGSPPANLLSRGVLRARTAVLARHEENQTHANA
jgi:hypothetical protein